MGERPYPQSITDHRKGKLAKDLEYWRMRTQKGEWESEAHKVEDELKGLHGEGRPTGTDAIDKVRDLVITEELLTHLGDLREDRRKRRMEGPEGSKPAVVEAKKEERPDPIVEIVNTLVSKGALANDVNDFLKKLDPTVVAAMYTAGQSNPNVPFWLFSTQRNQPEQITLKDVLELWRSMPAQQNPVTLDGIAQLMSTILSATLNRPQPQQLTANDLIQTGKALVEPFYQTLSAKDRELFDERTKALEEKIVNPVEYLKSLKEGAKELGLTTGGGTGVDLEGKKMDFEMKKLELDQQRWQAEQSIQFQRWSAEQGLKAKDRNAIMKLVTDTLLGPKGPLKKIVDAAADEGERRLHGGEAESSPTQTVSKPTPLIGKEGLEGYYPCENCKAGGKETFIPVKVGQKNITCETCGSVYERP